MRCQLRPEVLVIETDDGGVDLFDLLYERIEHLNAEEAEALAEGEPRILERLKGLVLLEGEHAETLRRQRYWRHKAESTSSQSPSIEEVDWTLASQLPDFVSAQWRDPEAFRRLAESKAAGNVFLSLPAFIKPEAARELADALKGAPFETMQTPWVRGERHVIDEGSPLNAWADFLVSEVTRALFSAVLARPLSPAMIANGWRLHEGGEMPVHPDGRRYQGTASLGLSEGWRACQGGAIAMGAPEAEGFKVSARWLPQLGDLLLFAPAHDTWHAVEPVLSGVRYSVTSWWISR